MIVLISEEVRPQTSAVDVEEKRTVRDAVFFMNNINDCIETIIKQVDNDLFRKALFEEVSYPLRSLLNSWDEWHDLEKGYNAILKQKQPM